MNWLKTRKQMEKAEWAVEKKVANCRKHTSAAPWRPRRPGHSGPPVPAAGVPLLALQPLSHPAVPRPNILAGRQPLGPCFACGGMGHLCSSCPKATESRSIICLILLTVIECVDGDQYTFEQ